MRCGECEQSAGDAVAAVAGAVGTAVSTAGRWTMRAACHWFTDEQLAHGRRVLRWRLSWEYAVAAALTYWLGRPASVVFVGMFTLSWVLAHGAAVELERRALRRDRMQPRPQPAQPVVQPDLDREAEAMIAAHKAGEAGR
jgi:hypothetical protein